MDLHVPAGEHNSYNRNTLWSVMSFFIRLNDSTGGGMVVGGDHAEVRTTAREPKLTGMRRCDEVCTWGHFCMRHEACGQ